MYFVNNYLQYIIIPKKTQKLDAGTPIGLKLSLIRLLKDCPNTESAASVGSNVKNPKIANLKSSKSS